MFKILTRQTFTRTVEVLVPSNEGHEKQTLKATFVAIAAEEVKRHDVFTEEGTASLLRQVIVRLDDLGDEDGNPVPYDEAVRDRVIGLPYARMALIRSYSEAVSGAKSGN